jgi:hypothetical protein
MANVTDNPVWEGLEVRVVEVKGAPAEQGEGVRRYVFGVPASRLEALRARFPTDNPEERFERALNEEQAALSKHLLQGLEPPSYRFVGAACTLPSPRPGPDYATPGGICVWAEKPSFKMGDWDGRSRR